MDALLFILVIGWAVSAIARSSKKRNRQAADQTTETAASPDGTQAGRPARRNRPMRPADVDLPGQTTMPIHWDGDGPTLEQYQEPTHEPRPVSQEMRDLAEAWRMPERKPEPAPTQVEPAVPTIPGLDLELTGDALVKGVIFSEILGRRPHRRIR